MSRSVVSLFTGAGGLDLGFHQAGFKTVWANDKNRDCLVTWRMNFGNTPMLCRDITLEGGPSFTLKYHPTAYPDLVGLIGGPPYQSWSVAGSRRGVNDPRGKLFFAFIEALKTLKPKFFVAENVKGILSPRHKEALDGILSAFQKEGYHVRWQLLNAVDYGVPQDRERVFFVGFSDEAKAEAFTFPARLEQPVKTLRDTIADLEDTAKPHFGDDEDEEVSDNHHYEAGQGFSPLFMSRNRVRGWLEPSFTIQASGRHVPLHPSAPKMRKVGKDAFKFVDGHLYRRLSVRECARIQGFPDDFLFHYEAISSGYRQVGNAVPPPLARAVAEEVARVLP